MNIPQQVESAIREHYRGDHERAQQAWGLSRSHLSRLLGGHVNPPRAVARELGITLAYVPDILVADGTAHAYLPSRKRAEPR